MKLYQLDPITLDQLGAIASALGSYLSEVDEGLNRSELSDEQRAKLLRRQSDIVEMIQRLGSAKVVEE